MSNKSSGSGNEVDAQLGPNRSESVFRIDANRVRGKKGKAGGMGKKGKVFLEDKAGLLSLISRVTDTKEQGVKAKLDKRREVESSHVLPKDKGKRKGSQGENVGDGSDVREKRDQNHKMVNRGSKDLGKRKLKEDALRAAKIALINEAKEKKRIKREKGMNGGDSAGLESISENDVAQDGGSKRVKKRVGFA